MRTKTDIKQVIAFAVMLFLSFAIFYYYIFYNPHILYSRGSDAAYYISIANNLFAGRGLYDATSIPKTPIITPQNGIVFIELLLMKAGIRENTTLFTSVAIINYLSFLFSAILLYRIADYLEVSKLVSFFIIANLLLSINIFTAIITPTNDGIAFTLSLFGLFLCIQNHEKCNYWVYLLIFVISVIGVHFRLQYLLIPLCGAFASLMVKQYRSFLIYLLISIVSFLFIYIPYQNLIKDNSAIHSNLHIFLSCSKIVSLGGLIEEAVKGFAILFLKFGEGRGYGFVEQSVPVFIIITVLIIYYCLMIVLRMEYVSMLISLVILSTIAFFLVALAASFRYIMIIFPLLMIILGSTLKWKRLVLPFFATYLLYGLVVFVIRVESIEPYFIEQKRQTELVMSLFNNDTRLFSEVPRISYILFNKSSSSDMHFLDGKNEVLLFGTNEFVLRWINQIKSESPYVRVTNFGRHWMIGETQRELVKVELIL